MKQPSDTWKEKDWTWLVILLLSLPLILFVHSRAYSTNDASRMATIESLVHRGTWTIDDSPFAHTLDKIKVGDHFYSDKPPMLSFLGAVLYAGLHHGFGLTLQSSGCEPGVSVSQCLAMRELTQADWAYVLLTWLLISLPALVIIVLMYKLARFYDWSNPTALFFVLVMGLGTALFPYSTVFTNHVPAAMGIFIAFYILLRTESPQRSSLIGAGFAAMFAVTLDLSAAMFAIAFAGYIFWRNPPEIVWYVVGALPIAMFFMLLNYQIVGNPLPPQFYAAGYDYEGTRLYSNLSGFQATDNVPRYAFDLLLGENGVFAFFPILIWYVWALIKSLRAPKEHERQMALVVSIAVMLYFLFFMLSTDNFGGFAFSPRWLLLPVPVLAAFALRVGWPLRISGGLAIALLAALSVLSTYRGALDPWWPARPFISLAVQNPEPRRYIPVALSGYGSFEHVNPDLRRSFGVNHVPRRWFDARWGLVIPPGEGWWFIHESTPLSPWLADELGLSAAAMTYGLNANLVPSAQKWLASMTKEAYLSESLSPQDEQEVTPVPLPVTFILDDDKIKLHGFDLHVADGGLWLITGWSIEQRVFPTGPRRLFAHLLDENGQIVAQDDSFAADYETLLEGDYFFQVQYIDLAALANGRYWLQLGVYHPDQGTRLLTESGENRLLLTLWTKAD